MLAYTYISPGKFELSTSQRSDCRACGKYTRREKKFRLFLFLFFCDSGGIDFASLVFHCVGSAITKQGDCAAHTAKTKRDDFQLNLKSPLFVFGLYEQHFVCHCSRSPRDSGGIRTHDPQLRRLLLYPTELRNHRHRVPYVRKMLRKGNQKLTIHNPFAENSLFMCL